MLYIPQSRLVSVGLAEQTGLFGENHRLLTNKVRILCLYQGHTTIKGNNITAKTRQEKTNTCIYMAMLELNSRPRSLFSSTTKSVSLWYSIHRMLQNKVSQTVHVNNTSISWKLFLNTELIINQTHGLLYCYSITRTGPPANPIRWSKNWRQQDKANITSKCVKHW